MFFLFFSCGAYARGGCLVLHQSFSVLFPQGTECLSEPRARLVASQLQALSSPVLGLQVHKQHTGLFYECWDLRLRSSRLPQKVLLPPEPPPLTVASPCCGCLNGLCSWLAVFEQLACSCWCFVGISER